MSRNPYGGFLIRKIRRQLWRFTPFGPLGFNDFDQNASAIRVCRARQSRQDVAALEVKYERPIFGRLTVMQLLEKMSCVMDPSDNRLGTVSQLVHTLQGLESMERAGLTDGVLPQAMLIHDLGKLLYLAGEAPENVFGMKRPLDNMIPGGGLDKVEFQWNHDDIAWLRFRKIVSEPVAWLVRYHSIIIDDCEPYMDARDRMYTDQYLREFQFHDQQSKSMYRIPSRTLEDYRPWIESLFAEPIEF